MCEGDDANDARLLWNDATEAHDEHDEKTRASSRKALKERKKIHARETQARHQSNNVLYKLFFAHRRSFLSCTCIVYSISRVSDSVFVLYYLPSHTTRPHTIFSHQPNAHPSSPPPYYNPSCHHNTTTPHTPPPHTTPQTPSSSPPHHNRFRPPTSPPPTQSLRSPPSPPLPPPPIPLQTKTPPPSSPTPPLPGARLPKTVRRSVCVSQTNAECTGRRSEMGDRCGSYNGDFFERTPATPIPTPIPTSRPSSHPWGPY